MKNKNIFKLIIALLMFFGGSIVIGLFLRSIGMDLTALDAKDESYLDCLINELQGSINSAFVDGEISEEQCDYLYNTYIRKEY